jgi:xanthine dehydrogenase YagT iron-sulfur-binding subunit
VSSKKDPDSQPKKRKPEPGFSRRGFLGGLGAGTGALATTGALETTAEAAPPAAIATQGPGEVPITLQINGNPVKVQVEPRTTLLDALRHRLDMTAAKRVCDRGTCGACTVIMNGKAVYACSVLAIDAQGKQIQTLEGIAASKHPVINAFVNHDAQQCGYCTPGFVVAAKNFLDRNPAPTMEQVKAGLGGNLCRCGTYVGVRHAVLEAAREMKAPKGGKA